MKAFDVAEDWVFFARGNANLVYRYVGQSPHLHKTLLRLRLGGQEYDTKHVYEFVESKIRCVLREVVVMELVGVTFHVDGALNDGFGLLMPDIIPHNSKSIRKGKYFEVFEALETFIVEIKPKWLRLTSRGCRNCAHHTLKHGRDSCFCSLGLLDPLSIKGTAAVISGGGDIQGALESYLAGEGSVFRALATLQNDIDLSTLTNQTQANPELCLQMTLRDVTVFLTIEHAEVTKAAITDVDPKSPTKWESWANTEKKLITQNLYSLHS